ncbi:MAG: carboxymuconolactone decarboxylase family protein [Lautropia sp.]|nr:carboxymuconolactone decarboxylase family protein [Lautropia sp.]
MAALLAQGGCEKQLHVHVQATLNVGLGREQIVECFIQCVPYPGFPKVLNAVFEAKAVFASREAP